MQSVEDLVLQAQLGDKHAYAALYDRFCEMALAYSLSIVGDYDLAEDARQEAFINAYCDILSLRDPKFFPAWFRKIVFSSSINVVRRRRKINIPLEEAGQVASSDPTALEMISSREEKKQIEGAINRLPDIECEVVKRFYLASQTMSEISQALGLPISTVKGKLRMARARLRQMLVGRAKRKIQQGSPAEKKEFLIPASREAIGQFEKELQTMLASSDPEGQNKIADKICAQARLHRFLGENEAALGALRRGLALSFVALNTPIRARLRAEMGLTYIQTANYKDAKRELRYSRGIIPDESQNQALLAAVFHGLGSCSWGQGAFRQAREFYEKSLSVGKKNTSTALVAATRSNLALLDWKEGRLTAALRNFESCLSNWKKVKCPHGTALTQMNLGIVEENLGHFLKAENHYQAALDSARKFEFPRVETAVQTNLANLALQHQQWRKAMEQSRQALESAKKIKDRRSESVALENLALAYLGLGNHEQCVQAISQARGVARAIGEKERLFSLDLVEVEMWLEKSSRDGILKTIEGLQKKLRTLGYRAELPRLLGLRGRAEHLVGASLNAKRTFAKAITECRKQGNRAAEQKIRSLMELCKTRSVSTDKTKIGSER